MVQPPIFRIDPNYGAILGKLGYINTSVKKKKLMVLYFLN
jgi:N-acetylglutamate synthase/N-acetylornithine aminotransferase